MREFSGKLALLVAFVASQAFCNAPKDQKSLGTNLGFDVFARLKPGLSSRAELTQILGKPDKVTDLKDVPGSSHGGERWEYLRDGLNRLTLFIGPGVETPHSFVFEVHEGDPERPLKSALSRYRDANWQVDTVKWINPHHFPDECFLIDQARGVRIEYRVERQEVSSIERWDPARKLATAPPDEKAPEYCMGGGCVPAIAATEFFKQWPINDYCKVPKLK